MEYQPRKNAASVPPTALLKARLRGARARGGARGASGLLRGLFLAAFSAALLVHVYVLAVYYGVAQREVRRLLAAALYVLAFFWYGRTTPPPTPARLRARARGRQPPVAAGSISQLSLRVLFALGATLSLLAPWAAVMRGSFATLEVCAPHMLVYAVQLLFETWSSATTAYIPLPMRLIVILSAITYRLKLLHSWIVQAPALPQDAALVTYLGYANVVYWALILQLLLVLVAPRYFPGGRKACARGN